MGVKSYTKLCLTFRKNKVYYVEVQENLNFLSVKVVIGNYNFGSLMTNFF